MSQNKQHVAPAADRAKDKGPGESSARVQFKRMLAGLDIDEQRELLQPPRPALKLAPVQAYGAASEGDADATKQVAASGLAGSAQRLPHLNAVQKSFGDHDVSGIKAHVGGAAETANKALGAKAYATGNQVAFKSDPALHTVAHEAAHVVQQRAGVSLSQGVGKTGDTYERHADAVADRVVQGKSAVDLLDAQTGTPPSLQRMLQFRASEDRRQSAGMNKDFLKEACKLQNVDYQKLLDWVKAKRGNADFISVEDAVAFLHGLETRDDYWNSRIKVQFENELGNALNADRGTSGVDAVLNAVLGWCLSYLQAKIARDGTDLKDEWKKMVAMHGGAEDYEKDLFYGRIADSIDEVSNGKDFYGNMLDLFSGQGSFSISQKCFAIQQFHNTIYEVDYTDQKTKTKQLMTQLNSKAMDPGEVRWGLDASMGDTEATDIFGKTETGGVRRGHNTGSSSKGRRGRIHENKREHGAERTLKRGLGSRDSGGTMHDGKHAQGDSRQKHGRGIDRWTMDERQAFIQQARLLDMPLAGSVSGTTSDLITVAMMAGVTDAIAKFKFICAALDHFVGAGAHTFHEVCTAAKPFGIDYTPGDYFSFFKAYLNKADFPTTFAIFEAAQGGTGPYKTVKGMGQALG